MEEDFISISSKISSLLLVSASLGSMIDSVVTGNLMDNFDPMWFIYITLAGGLINLVIILTAKYVSKYTQKRNYETL